MSGSAVWGSAWELLAPGGLFHDAVVGGLLVSLLCAGLGVWVALRRMMLLGVALPQVAAAGIACVFWATDHGHVGEVGSHGLAAVGAVTATLAALVALVRSPGPDRLPAEWRVGALLAVSMAATILFVALDPRGDLELTSLLRGDLLSIGDDDLRLLAAAAGGIGVLTLLFRRELLIVSFDPEYARTLGIPTLRYETLLHALLGVGIGLGVLMAGPVVVLGFLALPPLGALAVAPSLGAAFAGSLALALCADVGGFVLAYVADLPAGPSAVAVAALLCVALLATRTLARRRARGAMSLLAAALLAGLGGCAHGPEPAPDAAAQDRAPADRGTLPELPPDTSVVVLRVANATGQTLRIPSPNPLPELARAAGDPFLGRGETVPDRLQRMLAVELSRRGYPVVPGDDVGVREAPPSPSAAVTLARRNAVSQPVLQATLRRFARTGSDLLILHLDVALVEPADGRVLWSGRARGPYPVRGALTLDQMLLDSEPRLYRDLFDEAAPADRGPAAR